MKLRSEIAAEARRICTEIDQIFADAEHWNRQHPNEEPIDPDPGGEMARQRAAMGRMLMHESAVKVG